MRLFYHWLNTDSPVWHKLLNADEYCDFADKVSEEYFASDYFTEFCDIPMHQELVSAFMSDVSLGVYRRWKKKPQDSRPDIDTLADMTARMLMDGLNGLG